MLFFDTNRDDRVENPDRLDTFRNETKGLSWEQGETEESLHKMFSALDNLIRKEVEFYYKSRKSKRRISLFARLGAIIFGTVGTLMPLLASTGWSSVEGASPWGYVFLALAAGFLAGNSLFGGSSGHIRYVTAQLELEQVITRYRLKWQRMRAGMKGELNGEDLEQSFNMFSNFANDAYGIILEETNAWSETLEEAIRDISKEVSEKRSLTTVQDV